MIPSIERYLLKVSSSSKTKIYIYFNQNLELLFSPSVILNISLVIKKLRSQYNITIFQSHSKKPRMDILNPFILQVLHFIFSIYKSSCSIFSISIQPFDKSL